MTEKDQPPQKEFKGNPSADNYYQRLGVAPTATPDEIKAAYRLGMRKFHPDQNPDKNATLYAQNINEAYDTLSDSKKRDLYNLITGSADTSQKKPDSYKPNPTPRPEPNPGRKPESQTPEATRRFYLVLELTKQIGKAQRLDEIVEILSQFLNTNSDLKSEYFMKDLANFSVGNLYEELVKLMNGTITLQQAKFLNQEKTLFTDILIFRVRSWQVDQFRPNSSRSTNQSPRPGASSGPSYKPKTPAENLNYYAVFQLSKEIASASNLNQIVSALKEFIKFNPELKNQHFDEQLIDMTVLELYLGLTKFMTGKINPGQASPDAFINPDYSIFTKVLHNKMTAWKFEPANVDLEDKSVIDTVADTIKDSIKDFLNPHRRQKQTPESENKSTLSRDDLRKINFLKKALLERDHFLTQWRVLLSWAEANESLLSKPMFSNSEITPMDIVRLFRLVKNKGIINTTNHWMFAETDNVDMQHIKNVIDKQLRENS